MVQSSPDRDSHVPCTFAHQCQMQQKFLEKDLTLTLIITTLALAYEHGSTFSCVTLLVLGSSWPNGTNTLVTKQPHRV